MALFGSSRPRFGAGLVATADQEAETARLEALMQQRMPPPMGGMDQAPQAPQAPRMGWGEKVGGIGTALMAAQAAIDGDLGGSMQLSGSIGAKQRAMQAQLAAQQQAAAQRAQERDDWVWRQDYERANPKPVNNDTVNDLAFYKGLSPEDRALYHQMKPQYRQGPDGQFYPIAVAPVAPAAPPAITEDDWNKGQPWGGGAGNGAGGFPVPSGSPLQRPW